MSVVALVVAAGKGERVGGKIPKQFCRLEQKPLLYYSLEIFERFGGVREIVLVLPPQYCQTFQVQIDLKPFKKIKKIVPGGTHRQDSVTKGLESLPDDGEYVLIHDGVRPFPPIAATQQAIEAARETGAAILALPVTDTVKVSNPDGTIASTIDRRHLWLAQTPQIFRRDLIVEGYRRANAEGVRLTDDAGAVELIGKPIRLIQGSLDNLKITVEEDFERAARILASKKEYAM